jgi:hypothetical protein
MSRLLVLGLAAAFVFIARETHASPLDYYRWKARPVIVFGSEDNNAFRKQVAIFNRALAGFRERDIVLIPVLNHGKRHDLWGAYSVEPDSFEVLLVGKDGGVKFRSSEVVSPEEIFRLVDAMPMRREEMRR